MGEHDPGLQVGGRDPDPQVGGTNQCAYNWGDQTITHASGGIRSAAKVNAVEDNAAKKNTTKDKAPMDDAPMVNIQSNVPIDVDGDHTHPDEGDVPKTPVEGDVQKSLDEKTSKKMSKRMSKKMSKKPARTFQTETPAGKTESPLSKKEDNPPEGAKSKSGSKDDKTVIGELKVETTELKAKVKEAEFSQSTMQTRLTELETKSTSVVTDEAQEPTVAAETAPPMEVTSAASKEPAAPTPTVTEEKPAEDKSEVTQEEAADEPMGTAAKDVNHAVTEPSDAAAVTEPIPVGEDNSATEAPAQSVVVPQDNQPPAKHISTAARRVPKKPSTNQRKMS